MEISRADSLKDSLTNNGELAMFFIGTGSAFARTLNQNNVLVVKGQDHLLIDCGTKCAQALYNFQLPLADIRNYLITHSHADHIGGLEEAQLFGRYVSRNKPRMIINETYQQILWEQSLRGGSEMSEAVPLSFEDLWEVQRPAPLAGAPRETWSTRLGDISIKMPRTKHYPDSAESWRDSFWSCGVILDDRVLFTADTRFDPALVKDFDDEYNFEVIFHDCQQFTGGVHASLDELMTLPESVRRKTILMHYGDNWRAAEQTALDAGFHSWAQQGHWYRFPDS
ncbi:MAG: MBL fold metallo-hydrolase [Pseudomonadales bacterium]|nr:MBL fold metallo-hydrolase [Pseudomonadales bacterium]